MADPVLHSPKNPHFFQPLLPGFHSYLEIPKNFFSVHIEGRKERNTVELRSDASERSWEVKIEGRRLTVGWKDFANAHDCRIGDIIIFRQEGDLVFHVTCFGPSFCEIEYPQSSNKEDNNDEEEKEEKEEEVENIRNLLKEQNRKTEPESSPDESCFVACVTESNLEEDRLFLPRKFVGLKKGSNKIVLMDEGVRRWTLNLRFRKSIRRFNITGGWRSFCHENGLQPRDSFTFKLENCNRRTTPILRFSTAETKSVSAKRSSQKVSSSSLSSLSENRLVTLTVTPANLKHCQLYLPKRFCNVNGMEKAGGKKITMLDDRGVKWPVYLRMERGYMKMHLGLGLREFFEAIDIKAYESFVLELFWEDPTTPMFKFCSMIKTPLHFSSAETKSVSAKHSSKEKRKTGESSQRVSSSSLSSLSEIRFVTITATPASLKNCKFYLPKRFIRVNGLEKARGKKITMLDERIVKWPVNLRMEHGSKRMRLGLGFTEFLKAIDIKAYESFVLKLVWEDKTTPMLKFCSKTKTPLHFSTAEAKSVSTKHSSKGKRSQRVSSSPFLLSGNRFVTLTVTPASLKKCRLYLPASFIRANRMENAGGKKITLLDKHGVEWPVNQHMERRYTRMRLGQGLREFFEANDIKEYDSFVLELFWEDTTIPMLKFCSKIKTRP